MNATPVPWSVLSSSVNVGVGTDGWNLAEDALNTAAPRLFTLKVAFVSRFSLPPVVHLGLTTLDADQRDSARVSLGIGRITECGFEALVSTWSSSRIYAVGFNWLAIGA